MRQREDAFAAFQALEEKVREARELIGRLRDRNQALAAEIEELKRKLEDGAPASPGGESGALLRTLRREREEVRERLSRLLKQLEEL